MTWQQIESAREVRLWIGQIIVPTICIVGTVMTIPEVREAIATKSESVKWSIRNKMKKSES